MSLNFSSMEKKESRGRQKIKMAKIKNPAQRQVTFSKRRLGLFKKVNEICTLCGVEALILVYSPSQKIFSFGAPDVNSVLNHYLSRNPIYPQSSNNKTEGVQQSSTMSKLNSQLTKILDLLEAEKKRGEVFNNLRNTNQCWWEAPIDKLGLHELEILRASLEDLMKNVTNQALLLEQKSLSTIMGIDNVSNQNNGVVASDQHFDLQSVQPNIEGFFFPHQPAIFHAPNFF